MIKLLRAVLKLLLFASVVVGVAAGARALVGHLSGEPGEPSAGRDEREGSFYYWTAVPMAPGRDGGAGAGFVGGSS